MRARWATLGVVACALASVVVPAAASSAAPHGDRTMVVFFRSTGASFRSQQGRAAQASVLGAATHSGAQVLVRDDALGAATVRVTASQARALAASPLVAAVLPNTLVPGPTPETVHLGGTRSARGTAAHASCGTAAKPQLNPEGLGNINAVGAATEGYDGAGVTVAFIADGVDPANPDLVRNPRFASPGSPAGSRIATYANFGGDKSTAQTGGAEAFGDAASIAAQANTTYDLSRYVGRAHPLPAHCDIRIQGSAPGASLLALNAFGFGNSATASAMVQAINYAVAHGASVINESFGFNNFPDTSVDIIRQADDAAVAAGATVVVSSGDAGPDNTIGSPGSDPSVLTVGATTQYRAYAQLTFGAINALGHSAGYLDDNISSFSSGGVAQDGKTVDLVAPGDLGWSLCSPKVSRYFECGGQSVQLFGGTSESAPLTAGAAADVIEAYKKTHGGVAPSPRLVKQILTSTAVDISAPALQQGAGLLDVGAAVRLATSLAGTTRSAPPGGVLTDAPQVHLSGLPSSSQHATITLTNTATSAATVRLSTRALVPKTTNVGVTIVDAAGTSPDRTFVDSTGMTNVYRRGTFSVPAGTAHVLLQAAFSSPGDLSFSPIGVSLFAPNGDLAAYSLPQGYANYADVEASAPQPGRWTVVFFQGKTSDKGHASTRVRWSETGSTFARAASITPSVSLAAGATSSVQLAVTMPTAPGDTGFSVVLAAGTQHTTIPVTLRTEIPLTSSGGSFTGLLTGGNGRGGAPGQSNTYAFNVPAGERDLDVGIAMAQNPVTKAVPVGDEFGAFLIDPAGQTRAYSVNASLDPRSTYGLKLSRFCNLYAASPQAGAWDLVLLWFQPLDGWATSIPFAGSIEFDAVSVTSSLPHSAATTIPKAGHAYAVHVRNTGVAPMDLSPDARLSGTTSMGALPLFEGPLQPMPGGADFYYLPTGATSVNFRQVTNVPGTFEASSDAGDPLLAPTTPAPFETSFASPTYSKLTYSPPGGVLPGVWIMASDEIGPYPASGAKRGYVIQDVHVQAPAFDPAVTSTVPDLVRRFSTTRDSSVGGVLSVAPGATASIPITITPTGAAGAVVSGTLYVNEAWPELVPQIIAAIPYRYTVGS